MLEAWLEQIKWTDDGLVPAIAQDVRSGKVLMMAWMNRESLALTVKEQRGDLLVAFTWQTVAQGRGIGPCPTSA